MWLPSKKIGTFENYQHWFSANQSRWYFWQILMTWTFPNPHILQITPEKTPFLISKYIIIQTLHFHRCEDTNLTDCWFLPLQTSKKKVFWQLFFLKSKMAARTWEKFCTFILKFLKTRNGLQSYFRKSKWLFCSKKDLLHFKNGPKCQI